MPRWSRSTRLPCGPETLWLEAGAPGGTGPGPRAETVRAKPQAGLPLVGQAARRAGASKARATARRIDAIRRPSFRSAPG